MVCGRGLKSVCGQRGGKAVLKGRSCGSANSSAGSANATRSGSSRSGSGSVTVSLRRKDWEVPVRAGVRVVVLSCLLPKRRQRTCSKGASNCGSGMVTARSALCICITVRALNSSSHTHFAGYDFGTARPWTSTQAQRYLSLGESIRILCHFE